MGIETGTKISELNPDWPLGTDFKREGDNHIRLIKAVLQGAFDDSGTHMKFTQPVATKSNLEFRDAADKTRATLAASNLAGQGGFAITTFDEWPDQKSYLLVGSSVLRYSGDDATKVMEFDQSRQATATVQKVYMPAANVADITPGLWEPIANGVYNGSNNYQFKDLGAFVRLRLTGLVVPAAGAGGSLSIRTSSNNGVAWDSAASDYQNQVINATAAAVTTAFTNNDALRLSGQIDANTGASFHCILEAFNVTTVMRAVSDSTFLASSAVVRNMQGGSRNNGTARNALQIFNTGGTMQLRLSLEGMRG